MKPQDIEKLKPYFAGYYNNLFEIRDDHYSKRVGYFESVIRILNFTALYHDVIISTSELMELFNESYANEIISVKSYRGTTEKFETAYVLGKAFLMLTEFVDSLYINEEFNILLENKAHLYKVLLLISEKVYKANIVNNNSKSDPNGLFYNSAKVLYDEGHYNAARMAMELFIDSDHLNVAHNVFYFQTLIRIDENLSGNDYINNEIKAKKQYNKIINIFSKAQNVNINQDKSTFFSMIKDYNLFLDKVYSIEHRLNLH